MIVQKRSGGLRLVRQHDHALASGEMAAAWKGLSASEVGDGRFSPGPLAEEVVLAVALHDLGWRVPDRVPRLGRSTGLPYDFIDFPPDFRYRAISTGIDRVEELHPYAAVLVSLHHSTLGGDGRPADFEEEEQLRRAELLEDMGDDGPSPRRIRRDIEVLRLLDRISLVLCAAPPGAEPDPRLHWLAGGDLSMEWADQGTLRLRPYPFAPEKVEVEIPYRDLEGRWFDDRGRLESAWEAAAWETASFRLVPG